VRAQTTYGRRTFQKTMKETHLTAAYEFFPVNCHTLRTSWQFRLLVWQTISLYRPAAVMNSVRLTRFLTAAVRVSDSG